MKRNEHETFSGNGFHDAHDALSDQQGLSSAISDRVVPEMKNIMSSVSSGQNDTESGAAASDEDIREETNGLEMKHHSGLCNQKKVNS